ncbi:MAG: PaRep2b protein, partial [Thermoproteus sp. AZ2]
KHGYDAKVYLAGSGTLLIAIDEESIKDRLILLAWDRAASFAGLLSRVPERGIVEKYEALLGAAKEVLRREARLGAVEIEGKMPKATLVLSVGGEEFRYRLYYNGEKLKLEYYNADRAEAERAAAALMLFGVKAEARQVSGREEWRIQISTDGLAAGDKAIRDAVLKSVEGLWANKKIDEERYEELRAKLEVGVLPDAVLHVLYREQDNTLIIMAQPQSKETYDEDVKLLRDAGLKEGEHFTAEPPQGKKPGYIALRMPEGLEQLIRNALFANVPAAEKLRKEIEKQIEALGEGARQYYEKIKEKALSVGVEEFKGVREVRLNDGTTAEVELLSIKAYIDKKGYLRIKQRFKVDGVELEREAVFYRYRGRVKGYMVVRKRVEGDLRRLLAYCEAVGLEPSYIGEKQIDFTLSALEALMRFREVAEPIREWLARTD